MEADPLHGVVAGQRQVGRRGGGRQEEAPCFGHRRPLQGRSPGEIDQRSDPQWQILSFHVIFEDNVI